MTKKILIPFRLWKDDVVRLKQAARAYRAPSVNWFVEEMLHAMLNPALWEDFSRRLTTGAHQLTLDVVTEGEKKVVKRAKRKSRKGRKRPE